jgi:hypothetical protein
VEAFDEEPHARENDDDPHEAAQESDLLRPTGGGNGGFTPGEGGSPEPGSARAWAGAQSGESASSEITRWTSLPFS